MGQYVLMGCAIVITLAMIADASGTIHIITVVITVKGITFIVKKILNSLHVGNGEIINFYGNCIAGATAVGLIKNAIKGVEPVSRVLGRVGSFVNGLGNTMDRLGEFIEGLPFGLD
jgi:hypothetical protein